MTDTPDTDGLVPSDKEVWQKAFIAVLPYALQAQNWTRDSKAISSGEDRVNLAACWADYACKEHRERFGDD